MVQPRSRLWLRQATRRIGRRRRVRAYGDGPNLAHAGASARAEARSSNRSKQQGSDRDRAARSRRVGFLATAFVALIACSPDAPAQNPTDQNQPSEQNAPAAADAPVQTQLPDQPQSGLREVPLSIKSKTGIHQFSVDVAATPEQQERGLMFVKSLAPDRGMIFPYDPPQQIAFWMKNTLIPLDIIFIRADGTIARIVHGEPLSLEPLPSGEPVGLVLEIGGGRAAQLGIKEGDKVSWTH